MLTLASEAELSALLKEASARAMPLGIAGGGTRSGLGRPMQVSDVVSTIGMSGITLYEPSELVLSAKAGTRLADVEAVLAEKNQRLAFEPGDHRGLYGSSGSPTIGAVAAANISGPRRIQAGAARDSLIGVRAVTGAGETIRSGGRVMKNVTGYDLVKFLAGSFGTLAVLTEVTFKVLPVPETEATLTFGGLSDERGIAAMSAALGSPFSVTGAAHVPSNDSDPARTCLRVEGFADSVADRATRLARALRDFGTPLVLDAETSRAVWKTILDLDVLAAPLSAPVWRISVKPTGGPKVAAAARAAFRASILYDWGGGLVWVAGGEGSDAGAAVIRGAVDEAGGGHATLVRAPDSVRNAIDVFDPPAAPLMALTKKLKATFDPAGILNPGRMYAGV